MEIKKKGFTLVEAIIALSIFTISTSAVYILFSNIQKSTIKIEVKSELQQEAQVIQERFSTIGMQCKGIETARNKRFVFKSESESDQSYYRYTFYLKNRELRLKKEKISIKDGVGTESAKVEYDKSLGKNIDSINIMDISNNNILLGNELSNVMGIKIILKLSKIKGTNKEELEVSTMVNFRNK